MRDLVIDAGIGCYGVDTQVGWGRRSPESHRGSVVTAASPTGSRSRVRVQTPSIGTAMVRAWVSGVHGQGTRLHSVVSRPLPSRAGDPLSLLSVAGREHRIEGHDSGVTEPPFVGRVHASGWCSHCERRCPRLFLRIVCKPNAVLPRPINARP